jgi:hypothetical protein
MDRDVELYVPFDRPFAVATVLACLLDDALSPDYGVAATTLVRASPLVSSTRLPIDVFFIWTA